MMIFVVSLMLGFMSGVIIRLVVEVMSPDIPDNHKFIASLGLFAVIFMMNIALSIT